VYVSEPMKQVVDFEQDGDVEILRHLPKHRSSKVKLYVFYILVDHGFDRDVGQFPVFVPFSQSFVDNKTLYNESRP
jgi:hypothetical protein